MSLSIGARPGMNNPGDLTVSRNNQNLYSTEGQTGVYSSPNGLFYPVFATAQDGWNALVDWIQSNIGSNDANSITTPSELASYYLNGSFGPLQSTSLNPAANSWLQSLLSGLGISNPNAQLSQFSPTQIANAISKAEGTASTFGQDMQTVGSNGTLTPFQMGLGDLMTNPGQFFGILTSGAITPGDIVANGVGGTGQMLVTGAQTVESQTASAVGAGVSAAVKPLTDWLTGLTAASTTTRVAFGVVAVILLAAGIFFLAGNKSTTINVASLRGAVA